MRIQKIPVMMALIAGMLAFGAPMAEAQQQRVDQATFGNLIAALNNINAQLRALENVNIQDVDVRVVDISESFKDNQIEVIKNSINRNRVNITDNEILKNFLNNADVDVDISEVVAVSVLRTGDIILFVQ